MQKNAKIFVILSDREESYAIDRSPPEIVRDVSAVRNPISAHQTHTSHRSKIHPMQLCGA